MTSPHSHSFYIGTYNILNPFHAVKWKTLEGLNEQQEDNWDEWRREAILDNLQRSPLDICALQEVSARTYPELAQASLGGSPTQITQLYTHYTREAEGAHGVTILYRADRWEVVSDQGLKTPSEEYRCAACVDLRDARNQLVYRIISVHLKGYNPYEEVTEVKRGEQERGDQELTSYLESWTRDAEHLAGVIVLGDFNEDAEEMTARGGSSRQGRLITRGFTWSGAHAPTETRSGRQIDWILYQPRSTQDSLSVEATSVSQNLAASDHALTAVKLEAER